MGGATGPRTPNGKARSSRNAGKHWIQSGRILPDEKDEAALLRNGFAEYFKPVELIENEIVDDLTLNRLMKRRIDKAFTREFSKSRIEKTILLQENYERSATQYWQRVADPCAALRIKPEHSARLRPDTCIAGLEELRGRIAARGPQPEDLVQLRLYYGGQPSEHAASAMHSLLSIADPRTASDRTVDAPDSQKLKDEILELLATEIELQREREKLENEVFAIESAPEPQEPAPPMLDNLLRYRKENIREFNDLLGCLERMRRLRDAA